MIKIKNLIDKYDLKKSTGNDVHQIVQAYLMIKGTYARKALLPMLYRDAKILLEVFKGDVDEAIEAIDKMNYKATKGHFNWNIGTLTKLSGRIRL